ncbi:MAG TPA: TolC family protein [Thermoanaerobaculia bacterium]|nr:TolC family protein [Thermoanaerobaculia bacterium]
MNDRIGSRLRHWVSLLLALGAAAASSGQTPPSPEVAPLTLRRAAELALERAPQLAATRAAREEGSASARIAADALHPSVWVSTTPGYSSSLPTLVAGSVPAYGAIAVRQTIWDPWKSNDALQAQAKAAELEGAVESGCAEAVRSTVIAYARNWTDELRAEAARKGLTASDASLQRTLALFEAGRSTSIDVERARLQAARAKQKLLNAESDRDLDGLELKRLIGWPASAPLRLTGDTEAALVDVSSTDNLAAARAADPELKSLGRQVELLGRSAKLSSRRWPIVEASVQYQRLPSYYAKYYNSFNENDFSVGISLAIPVWAGGRIDDTEARARASVLRAQAEREARESDLEVQVRRVEAAVARADAEHSLSRRAQGIAEQDLTAAETLAREGRGEASRVDEKRIETADADEDAAKTALAAFQERVGLLLLRGDLSKAVLGSEPPCAVAPAPR